MTSPSVFQLSQCGFAVVQESSHNLNVMTQNDNVIEAYEDKIAQLQTQLQNHVKSDIVTKEQNVGTTEEMRGLQRHCHCLEEQYRSSLSRSQFKDDIIREMRYQLKQAKARLSLKPLNSVPHTTTMSLGIDQQYILYVHQQLSEQMDIDNIRSLCLMSRRNPWPNLYDIKPLACEKNSSPVSLYYDSNFAENCDVDQMDYLQSKLMALLQILRNKDEMLQIQEESLRMADMRVAELTQRSKLLQDELDRKIQEVGNLHGCGKKRWQTENSSPINDREGQMILVNNGKIKDLNSDLAILEKLYRDSFFESARMDAMMDLLRSAYLEIRLKDSNRIKEVDELQNTVVSQKRSLNKCKDILREIVELKSEISRVISKIDNDAVLWQTCIQEIVTNEVSQDLQDMKSKLLQLKDILLENNDTWNFEMENKRLQDALGRYKDENMVRNERNNTLAEALKAKEACVKYLKELLESKEKQIHEKDSEILVIKDQHTEIVAALSMRLQGYELQAYQNKSLIESTTQENISSKNSIEGLKEKLKTTTTILRSKDDELESLQTKCKDQEHTMKMLKDELNAAQLYLQENSKLRNQLIMLTNQVVHWQNQLSDYEQRTNNLEMKLVATQAAYNDLQKQYRNKNDSAVWLEIDLSEASSRGAELCAESRQVVSGVRSWMQRMRHEHQHLALKIKELQQRNQVLKLKLHENRRSASTLDPSFSFSSMNSMDEVSLPSRRQSLVGAESPISGKPNENWIDAVDNVAKSLQGNNSRWRHKLDQHRSNLSSKY